VARGDILLKKNKDFISPHLPRGSCLDILVFIGIAQIWKRLCAKNEFTMAPLLTLSQRAAPRLAAL
jgi:hypothetical protein